MSVKKIKNVNLFTEIASSGNIAIFEMNEQTLKDLGYLDEDGWPSGDFVQVLQDLDTISPVDLINNTKFWDPIDRGFSIYNKFLESGENEE